MDSASDNPHAGKPLAPEPYKWVFRVRGLLMAPSLLVALFVFYGETERHSLVLTLGLGLFLAGVAVRVWAQMHLHYRLRVKKQLTQTGPYGFVRNPIYIANTAIVLGLVALSELLWFLPIMLVWCIVVYSAVVRYEEAHSQTNTAKPISPSAAMCHAGYLARGRGRCRRCRCDNSSGPVCAPNCTAFYCSFPLR